jgi:hypothetical protein
VNLLGVLLVLIAVASYALGGAQLLLLAAKAAADAQIGRYEMVAARHAKLTLTTELAAAEQSAVNAGNPYQAIGQLAPMGMTALCDDSAPCGYSATATFVADGETDGASGPTASYVVAPNVETVPGISERRVAVTMTVNIIEAASGNVVHSRPQRVKIRLWAPNNAEAQQEQDAGARLNRVADGAAENEGCAADGTGCDPNRVSAADPTTVDGRAQCVQGPGSGTCAAGESRPQEQKSNITWSNAQSHPVSGP